MTQKDPKSDQLDKPSHNHCELSTWFLRTLSQDKQRDMRTSVPSTRLPSVPHSHVSLPHQTKKLLAIHAAKSNFSTALIWSEVVGSGFLSNMQVLQSTILVPWQGPPASWRILLPFPRWQVWQHLFSFKAIPKVWPVRLVSSQNFAFAIKTSRTHLQKNTAEACKAFASEAFCTAVCSWKKPHMLRWFWLSEYHHKTPLLGDGRAKSTFHRFTRKRKIQQIEFQVEQSTSPQVFFRKRLLCPCRHSKPHKQTGKQAQCQLIQGLQSLKQSIAFGLVFLQQLESIKLVVFCDKHGTLLELCKIYFDICPPAA